MVDQKNILQSMGAHEISNHFRPVNCKEKDIKSKAAVAGFLYFTQDTHKIYQGLPTGEYQMVGGSSSIFYGTRNLTDDEKYGDQVYFTFSENDVEGEDMPSVGSLILNAPDGGFYRVVEVEGGSITTQRLAIAGGGGGVGPGGAQVGSLIIDYDKPTDNFVTILSNTEHQIKFIITAKDAAGDLISETGTATWRINGKEYTQRVRNGENSFRVDEYLDYNLEENVINLAVSMTTGGAQPTIATKTWRVKVVNLELSWPWTYSSDEYRTGETFTLTFTPYGNVDCRAYIIFDNGSTLNQDYFIEDIPSYKTGSEYNTKSMPSLSYGEHTCSIYLETTINAGTINAETKRTEPITRKITFTRGGSSTILTVPYFETSATQYDTVNIPFLVYDPDSEICNVTFEVNDNYVASDDYDRGLHYWPYTITSHGTIKLTLKSTNGDTAKEITLIVNPLDLNVSEVTGTAFNLKAINFSSNEEVRNWKSGSNNEVSLRFSDNFDWSNGGLQFDTMPDGSIEKYIRIRQGTWMEIDYKLFKDFTTGTSGGKCFKFCFKATNCYDYEAPVLSCIKYIYNEIELNENTYIPFRYYLYNTEKEVYESANNEFDPEATYYEKTRTSGIGLEFDAQKATFSSAAYPNFATQYYENSYIEVECEIWPKVEDKKLTENTTIYGDRYMMIWVDGVPAGAKPYTTNMSLTQVDPQVIRIGSDLCDVCVYVAKAYERRLSTTEHLDNFIMDAPSVNKMLDRYRRNDILDTKGEISYEKLVTANPGCRAYLYEIPYMTKTKDDKVDGCTYYELIDGYNTLDKPYMKGNKTRIYVQGTSSAAYGIAAFNIRSDFTKKGAIYDKDGNLMDGWKVRNEALPIDIACTKVNVASCENANNVVNAEWYNKFQPYWDAHRRKGYKTDNDGNLLYNPYRDCMEFRSGVVFIKDNNKNLDYYDDNGDPKSELYLDCNVFLDENYTKAPFFRMYSIGNMGNDKKNINVFHDVTNPRAACVEVRDNQNAEHWMTLINEDAFIKKVIGYDKDGKEITEGPYYEFRYGVVENEDMADNEQGITEESQREDFMRFVRWMAHNDPSPYNAELHPYGYTGALLVDEEGNAAPVTYPATYTFRGFDPPGYENKTNPTGISLKGFTTNRFGGQYTHDTYEYRIAKLLHECEDYMVMDSVVFHYLYILRHTMVDNVAKNTFWSTEDGLHWDLTKNYDNDTSDGNDNTGNLTYTYGLEYGDLNTNGKDVFNASPSVWANFIDALEDVQKYLFQELEKKGAWSASDYLNEFKKHQDIIPERCWIEDYMRKYLRPRQLGLDEQTFLNRLEGGRKGHQRTQFETYQEFYMNSKYVAGTAFSDSAGVEFRLNKDPNEAWDSANVLPISFYIDCYATAHLGGQLRTSGRLKRGQIYNIPVGQMVEAPSDATCYIYGASMIQTMSGLAKLYPGYAKMLGANKLRSLEIGSDEEGYFNARLYTIDVGTNAMLQRLQARNCGDVSKITPLVLERATQLNELLLGGSVFKEISLAPNATTSTLELNPLSIMSATNLQNLTSVTADEGIYNSVNEIYINNCPALDSYTYKFAKAPQLTRYQFTDVNWIIDGTTEDDFVLDEDDNVIALTVLENLTDTDTAPRDGTTTKTALTGTITIDTPCNIDEYLIYKTYAKIYPNLIITYTNKVGNGLNRAVELLFVSTKEGQEQYYRVLGSGDEDDDNIATLISSNGPLGVAMQTPRKEDSASETFDFTGYWIHEATDGTQTKYYNPADFAEDDEIEENAISFADKIPTENMIFYPEYNVQPRQYKVYFRDWEGKIIPQNGKDYHLVNYNTIYDGPMENFHYRDSSSLADNMRWAFQGWSKNQYKDAEIKNPEYIDLKTLRVTNDITLHGHYLQENCRLVASRDEYFQVVGRTISISEDYVNILEGKITIPSKINDVELTTIGNFKNLAKVTHVFFLGDNITYTTVSNDAFRNSVVLQSVELPVGITSIGQYAFANIPTLYNIIMHDNITSIGNQAFVDTSINPPKLPAKLTTIGTGAFMNNPALSLSTLPQNLKEISQYAFYGCPKLNISYFGGIDAKLESIGAQAFASSGNNNTVIDIYFGESVDVIGTDAFANYGKNYTVKNIAFAKNYVEEYLKEDKLNYHTGIEGMGFTGNYDNVIWSWKGEGV